MAASKQDVGLLVRMGVLEKLVDRLTDKVERLESMLRQVGSTPVHNETEDEWAINNANGTVEKKEEANVDELEQLMSNSI